MVEGFLQSGSDDLLVSLLNGSCVINTNWFPGLVDKRAMM